MVKLTWKSRLYRWCFLFIAAFTAIPLLLSRSAEAASDVVMVLSSDLGPYREAQNGFESVLGKSASVIVLSEGASKISGTPRVIVAFGGKAALQKYPSDSILIYALSPGTLIVPTDRRGLSLLIPMMPSPRKTVDILHRLQPGLKRIGSLYASKTYSNYAGDLEDAGLAKGMQIVARHVASSKDLPDHLRQLSKSVQAIWIPTDPLLLTPDNLTTLIQFSHANRIPLYSAVQGMTDKGAVGTISTPYEAIGRAAGDSVKDILNGNTPRGPLFSDRVKVTLNENAAAKTNVTLPLTLPVEWTGGRP